jgi:hypothetical protein
LPLAAAISTFSAGRCTEVAGILSGMIGKLRRSDQDSRSRKTSGRRSEPAFEDGPAQHRVGG